METGRDPRVREALRLAGAGEKEQARQLLIEFLRHNRDDFYAWVVMAQVTGDHQEAVTCMKRALLLRPDDERANRYLEHLLQSEKVDDNRERVSPWLWFGLGAALITLLLVVAFFIIPSLTAPGQTAAGPLPTTLPVDCAVLINKALEISDQGCRQIGRNELCYGHNTVQAELISGSDAGFDKPGSTIPISILEKFIAAPLDVQKNEWGVGVFRLETNLPGTLPGQLVTMLAFGDTSVQNASNDMQAFYFTSGLGGIQCNSVDLDGLLVRMPDGAGFVFRANGTDITLQGNSILKATAGDKMSVTMLNGTGKVGAFDQVRTLGPGQKVSVPLGGSSGVDAKGPPGDPETPDDAAVIAGCMLAGQNCPSGGVAQISTNTPAPVDSHRPTNTPEPIDPGRPTNTPVPVPPGQPTNTPVPLSTSTPVPLATNTSVPVSTATSTANSGNNTNTPQSTPTKTRTPTPTSTATLTKTPTLSTSTPALPTVCLFKSDGTTGIPGGTVTYYKGGWQSFGTTGSDGCVSSDIPDGNYTFSMTYEGGNKELAQDVGANPIVIFKTANVTVRLLNSTGSPLDTGTVKYYAGGWRDFGNTSGGQVSKELLPRSYTFGMTYEGGYIELAQDVGANPTVDFRTVAAVVQMRSSTDSPLDTGTVKYYAGGWRDFGSTSGGQVSKELLPRSYTFGMTYDGGYIELAQDIGTNPTVVFRTAGIVVQLRSSTGGPLDTGVVKYYAGGWRDLGSTSGGHISKELLPRSYTFGMTYEGGYVELSQDVGANPTVVFQTVNVTVWLQSSGGSPLDTGTVQFYAGGWRDFGSTSGGQVSRQLLPKSYNFRMTYGGASNEITQDIGANPMVVFRTGQVISDSGTCTSYYASGWQTFISGMELLPKDYNFRFNDGTGETQYTIVGGSANHIH